MSKDTHSIHTDVIIFDLPMIFGDYVARVRDFSAQFGDRQILFNWTTDDNKAIFILAPKNE